MIYFVACRDAVKLMEELLALDPEAIVVDASAVYNREHILAALMHAERAFAHGRNRARDKKIEVMLYIACTRQIKDALQMLKVSNDTRVIAVITDKALENRNYELIENYVNPEAWKKIGIDRRMVDVVGEDRINELIFERMAELEVAKR